MRERLRFEEEHPKALWEVMWMVVACSSNKSAESFLVLLVLVNTTSSRFTVSTMARRR